MKEVIEQLQSIIADYTQQLNDIAEEDWRRKPNPLKWSKKEILGHLIDSAQNNARRFVVAQYEDSPCIIYAQDDWVKLADYNSYNTNDLITLWTLLNRHICIILAKMPAGNEKRLSMSQELHTIEWLAADYNKHLLHHLHHLLEQNQLSARVFLFCSTLKG